MPRYCVCCILFDNRPGVTLTRRASAPTAGTLERTRASRGDRHAQECRRLVEAAHARHTEYDCVISVSGGRDSVWRVVTWLEHELRPLGVTSVYPGRSALRQLT